MGIYVIKIENNKQNYSFRFLCIDFLESGTEKSIGNDINSNNNAFFFLKPSGILVSLTMLWENAC